MGNNQVIGQNIGIYGGTFNPIHFGHINLALELKEKKHLAEVWVMPAHLSPLRLEDTKILPVHRLQMTKLAFEEIPGFRVLDFEMNRPPPSYTLDTVLELKKNFPDKDFFLLLGEDTLNNFLQWKGLERLIEEISLLIGTRKNRVSLENFPEKIRLSIEKGLIPIRELEISATDVRQRLKKGLYCGHLVPAKVLDYLCENQLYFEA